jgi:ABC-type nitrate/sulfonate/bicarbonate transport system permease component
VSVIIFGILLIGATNLVTDYCLAALLRRWLGRWHAT